MKKHFSRIIIPFFIVAILFGVFGVGEVNAQSYQDVTNPTGGLTVPAATTPSVGPTINSATNAQMIVLCQQQFAGDLTKINDCIATAKGIKGGNASVTWAALTGAWQGLGNGIMTFLNIAGAIFTSETFATWYATLYAIAVLMSAFLSISAGLFTAALVFSVQNFTSMVSAVGIETIWVLFRNTINIFFIFLMLYEAIKIITGQSGSKGKTAIANIIISALLINFSLLFTKVIIDAGNLLAVAIYNASGGTFDTFAEVIMQGLSLSTIISLKNITVSGQLSTIMILVSQILVMIFLFWAYMYAAILFIGRAFMLIFLLVTSPIGFLQDIIPQLNDYTKEWRKKLLDLVFMAPIFFFCLLIVNGLVTVIGSLVGYSVKNNLNLMGVVNHELDVRAVLGYIFIIYALIASVKITKKMSGKLGEYALKLSNLVTSAVVTTALPAMAGKIGASAAFKGTKIGANLTNVSTVFDRPGFVGNTFRSLKTSSGKTTGLDLNAYSTYKKKNDAEYEKQMGEMANKIGPAKTNEQIADLKGVEGNIKTQAEQRLGDRQVPGNAYNNLQQLQQHREQMGEQKKTIEQLKKIGTTLEENRGFDLKRAANDSQKAEINRHYDAEKKANEDKIEKATIAKRETEGKIENEEKEIKKARASMIADVAGKFGHTTTTEDAAKGKITSITEEKEKLTSKANAETIRKNEYLQSFNKEDGVQKSLDKIGLNIFITNTQKIAQKILAKKGDYKSETDDQKWLRTIKEEGKTEAKKEAAEEGKTEEKPKEESK